MNLAQVKHYGLGLIVFQLGLDIYPFTETSVLLSLFGGMIFLRLSWDYCCEKEEQKKKSLSLLYTPNITNSRIKRTENSTVEDRSDNNECERDSTSFLAKLILQPRSNCLF